MDEEMIEQTLGPDDTSTIINRKDDITKLILYMLE
jgi:hypothetical protein